MPPARIVTKDEAPVTTDNESANPPLEERIKFLEERNQVLETRVLSLEKGTDANVDPDDIPMIVHRIPVIENVAGVGNVQSFKEIRIPLSENHAFEVAHGLR
jgi:hypothetical protein